MQRAERVLNRHGPSIRLVASWLWVPVAIAIVAFLAASLSKAFWLNLMTTTLIFGTLGVSLNLAFGLAGRLSIAHGALFGVGAYCAAISSQYLTESVAINFAIAAFSAGLLAALVAVATIRVEDIFFAIVSFAIAAVVILVISRLDVTGGVAGMRIVGEFGVIDLVAFRFDAGTRSGQLALAGIILIGALAVSRRIQGSRYGLQLASQRDNPALARAFGMNVTQLRFSVLVLSGMIAGVAGAFQAYFLQHISPLLFIVGVAIEILVIVILGGVGIIVGPVVGALVLVFGLELVPLEPGQRLIGTGVVLLVLILYFPQGILGSGPMRRVHRWWKMSTAQSEPVPTAGVPPGDQRQGALVDTGSVTPLDDPEDPGTSEAER